MRGSAAYNEYQRQSETIRVMTYEEWEEVRESAERVAKRKKEKARRKREAYFKAQRLFGVGICLFAVVVIMTGFIANITNLMGLGDVIAIVGLYTIFTKRMIYVNAYFLELHNKR